MPASLLSLKVIAASSTVATIGVGAGVTLFTTMGLPFSDSTPTNNSRNSFKPKVNWQIVVNSETLSSITTPTTLKDGPSDKNYKCKLKDDAHEDLKCKITALTLTNNWIDLAGIRKSTNATEITISNLTTANKYFKIEVDKTLFSKVDFTASKTIELHSVGVATNPIAHLTPLFKIGDKGVEYKDTTHLLGKVNKSTVASSKTYNCQFSSTRTAEDTTTCTFYPFGSSAAALSGAGYSNQTPTSLLGTASTSLTPNQYYIIQKSAPLTPTDITHSSSHIFDTTDPNASAGTFSDVVASILHGAEGSKKAFILSETPNFSVVVQKTDASTPTKSITHSQQTKSFKCKVDTSTVFDCNLVPLGFTSTKTSMNLTEIRAKSITADLTIDSSTPANSYYKVEIPAAQFTTYESSVTNKSIQIVDSTDPHSTIITLTPIFAINDTTVYFDKSTYLVSGATSIDSTGLTTGKQTYCTLKADSDTSPTAHKCELTELTPSLAAANFAKATTKITTITADKTYVVDFLESDKTAGLAKDSEQNKKLIFSEENTAGTPSPATDKATFSNANIERVILVPSVTSGQKYAFILKN